MCVKYDTVVNDRAELLQLRQRWLSFSPVHKLIEVWLQSLRWLFVPSNYFAFLVESGDKTKQAMASQEWNRPWAVIKRDCQISLFQNWHAAIRVSKRRSRSTRHSQAFTCLQDAFRRRHNVCETLSQIYRRSAAILKFPYEAYSFHIREPRVPVIRNGEPR